MGERFGPYVLEARIGSGGMGEVWRARDTEHANRVVALKLLPPGVPDPEFEARFRREAELVSGLRSPHVVTIHRYGQIEGRLFIDMPLVDGVDLADLLHDGGLPPWRAVAVVGQVAAALDAAHRENLLHRDVKPGNIRLTNAAGELDFVYLMDFGIAVAVRDGSPLTATGQVIGTFHYMAPERFGGRDVDRRADVYALAGVLYTCLTGEPPFDVADLAGALNAHLHRPPPRVSDRRADAAGFDAVVARGMAKSPSDRFASAGDLAAAARSVLATGTSAPATRQWSDPTVIGPPPGHRPRPRRSRRLLQAVGAAVLIVLVGAGAVLWATGAGGTSGEPARPGLSAVAPLAAGQVVRIPVGTNPTRAATSPDGRYVYVADLGLGYGSGSLSVIDAASDTVVRAVAIPGSPYDVAVAPDNRTAYVSDYNGGAVRVVDLTAGAVVAAIPVAARPDELELAPDGRRLYVSDESSGALTVVAVPENVTVATWSKGATAGPSSDGIAVSADGAVVYVVNREAGSVSVLDGGSGRVRSVVPVGPRASGAALTPDGRRLFVGSRDRGSVSAVDTSSLLAGPATMVGGAPFDLAVSPDGRSLYVGDFVRMAVSTVDVATTRVTGTMSFGGAGQAHVAVAPGGRRAYISDRASSSLIVLGLG